MTTITTSATYKTQITADLPDWGTADVTFELVASFFNGAGEEVIAGKTYVMTLDAAGNDSGSFYLPTPDNSGAAGANWRLTLPSGHLVVVTVAYSASAQSVSDLIAAGSTTTDPDVITAALANKASLVTGATAGNLASLTSGGDLADSGYAAGDFDAAGSAAAVAGDLTSHTGDTDIHFTQGQIDITPTQAGVIINQSEIPSGTSSAWENESSSFCGWGTRMGVIPRSDSVKIYVRSWDAGSLISRVRLIIKEIDYNGLVLYDGEVSITPTHNTIQECNFVFDSPIGDSTIPYWIEMYANGKCGLNYSIGYTATTTVRDYTTSLSAIDAAVPTLVNPSTASRIIYHVLQPSATMDSGVSDLVESETVSPDVDRINTFNLRRCARQAAKIEYGDTEFLKIGIIGDSWVNTAYRIVSPLRTRLAAIYGDAGYGWVGASTGEAVPSALVTRTYGGSWTYVDSTGGGAGPSLHHAVSGATGATITFTATSVVSWKIHYRKQTGGGDFRWRVAGGAWNAVDTNGTAASFVIDAAGAGDLDIEVTAQDTAGVLLLGCEAYLSTKGVLIHKIGNSGATAARFTAANETIWKAAITNLALDAAVICLGTNDMSGNITPASYAVSMMEIAARIRGANKTTDILFLSPSDNGLTGKTYTMLQYSNTLYTYAKNNNKSWLDLWRLFGDYTNAAGNTLITTGMYDDNVHPSIRGGMAIGKLLSGVF